MSEPIQFTPRQLPFLVCECPLYVSPHVVWLQTSYLWHLLAGVWFCSWIFRLLNSSIPRLEFGFTRDIRRVFHTYVNLQVSAGVWFYSRIFRLLTSAIPWLEFGSTTESSDFLPLPFLGWSLALLANTRQVFHICKLARFGLYAPVAWKQEWFPIFNFFLWNEFVYPVL